MKPILLQAGLQSRPPPDSKRLPVLLFDVMGTLVFDPFYTDMAGFFGSLRPSCSHIFPTLGKERDLRSCCGNPCPQNVHEGAADSQASDSLD